MISRQARGAEHLRGRKGRNEERKESTHHHIRNDNYINNNIPVQEVTVSTIEAGTPDAETVPERGEAAEAGTDIDELLCR